MDNDPNFVFTKGSHGSSIRERGYLAPNFNITENDDYHHQTKRKRSHSPPLLKRPIVSEFI